MIECIICEDWYHSKHLDIEPPKDGHGKSAFDEFICFLCCNKYAYLSKYSKFADKNGICHIFTIFLVELQKQLLEAKNTSASVGKCLVKDIAFKVPYTSLYFNRGWRSVLCRCADCIVISFILKYLSYSC